MYGFGDGRRRLVAVALLVAVLAVFGIGTSANAQSTGDPSHGAVVLAVATPPVTGLGQPQGAPDLPLADAETTAPRGEQLTPTTVHLPAEPVAPPRAHRQPAADRAPPA